MAGNAERETKACPGEIFNSEESDGIAVRTPATSSSPVLSAVI
jgi:hypothetical protein